MTSLVNVYKEEILDHYKDPQNFGKLEKFSAYSKLLNPFCGDEIEIFVDERDGEIADISFQGVGCAVSIASASILTEYAKHKIVISLRKFSDEDMLELLAIEVSETRKKCALLAWSALHECLEK